MTLRGRIKRLLLRAFHLLNLLAKIFIVIHEVHLIVTWWVEVQGFFDVSEIRVTPEYVISSRWRWKRRTHVTTVFDGALHRSRRPLGVETSDIVSLAEGPLQVAL